MIKNAAVFINGTRHVRNVDVVTEGDQVIVKRRNQDIEIERFTIQETAKEDMAWDVAGPRGGTVRLVAQVGCGCSGLPNRYNEDETYTGKLTQTGKEKKN